LRRCPVRNGIIAAFFLALASTAVEASPFATTVMDYTPAPGQFVNFDTPEVSYNDPEAALGAPSGGGYYAPDNSSLVSLGSFGGSLTLGFDHTVLDDPYNPLGLDAIVFGNAFWVSGNDQRHWAECGFIEISLDENGDGLANDAWYLIPGSHISDPTGQYDEVTWSRTDPSLPPSNKGHYPDAETYPEIGDTYTTSGYRLPDDVFGVAILENPNSPGETEGIYGYADLTPTLVLGDTDCDNIVDDPLVSPEVFYTTPDDPFTVGINEGSGGGDAFDIAWAIDPLTGLAADLWGFDFIRITTAVFFNAGVFGEISTEIDAVADVAALPHVVPAPSAAALATMALAAMAALRRTRTS
jgi:hypothetical protein